MVKSLAEVLNHDAGGPPIVPWVELDSATWWRSPLETFYPSRFGMKEDGFPHPHCRFDEDEVEAGWRLADGSWIVVVYHQRYENYYHSWWQWCADNPLPEFE